MTIAGEQPQAPDPYQPTLLYEQPPLPPQVRTSRSRGRVPVIVLSILLVLTLVGAGTFGALYFTEKQSHEQDTARQAVQLTAKDKSLADATKAASDAKTQVQDATSRAQQAQGAKDEAEAKAEGYAKCHDSAKVLLDSVIAQDDAKSQNAIKDVFTNCR